MSARQRVVLFLALVLGVAITLPACAPRSAAVTKLRGVVYADRPVRGADIRILDENGTTIAAKEQATDEGGRFSLDVDDLPRTYTVVAEGGTRNGKALGGDLKAQATSDDATDEVFVSPVSSLAAEYAAANPDVSPADSVAHVKDALGIPDETDTTSYATWSEPLDTQQYMVQADVAGGLDDHEAALADQVDPGVSGELRTLGLSSDDLVGEVAKAAAGKVGSAAAGWVLHKAGMRDQSDDFADIKGKLDALQASLKAMSAQIQQVHLAVLTAEILHRDQMVRSGTEQVDQCTTPPVDPQTIATALENGRQLRLDADSQPFNDVLTDNMRTNQSGGGLLHEYRTAIWGKPFVTSDDVASIQGQFGYYRQLQAFEYLLVAEYLHATDSAGTTDTASPAVAGTISRLGDLYKASLADQQSKYAPPEYMHPNFVYCPRANLIVGYWMTARYDDRNYSSDGKGIRRSDKTHNVAAATTFFNNHPPGGFTDWRIPTKAEINLIFQGNDFDPYYQTDKSQYNRLPKGGIIWTSEWQKGWAYDTGKRQFFNYNRAYDPDSPPDMYNGITEKYSPGPASILFVRTPAPGEGFWATPGK